MPNSDLAPQERAARAFKFFDDAWSRNGYGAWMITNKRNGQLLGDCYLESEEESGSGYVEIGYDVGRDYWGRGIATEAAHAVLRFAFENTPVERIVGVAVKDNVGSQRVLEHIGFTFEKEALLYDLDVVVYAISRDQFHPYEAFYRVSWS